MWGVVFQHRSHSSHPEQFSYVAARPSILQLLIIISICVRRGRRTPVANLLLQGSSSTVTSPRLTAFQSAVGQTFIFYTISTFDSLTLTTITTTRKFFTVWN